MTEGRARLRRGWSGRGVRKGVLAISLTMIAAAGVSVAGPASAVAPWSDIPAVATTGASAASLSGSPFDATDGVLDTAAGIATVRDLPSGQSDDSFRGGVKEDTACPGIWLHKVPPHKDDLLTLMGAARGSIAYIAWTRAPGGQGTATIDFELNQAGSACGNGVSPQRTPGDLIFNYDFRAGNLLGVVVRVWNGTSWNVPVALDPSQAQASVSANGLFGEMAIDVSTIPDLPKPCESFVSAFAKSRASTSFSAQMKDVIRGVPVPAAVCLPDLAVNKTGPAQVELGQDITYSITVTNTGKIPVPDATFTDDLPAGTTLVSLDPLCVKRTPTSFTCNVGTLAPGVTSNPVVITVHPIRTGTVVNTAKVPTDQTPNDDTSTVTTTVVNPPQLTFVVDKLVNANGDQQFNPAETAATPGGPVTYRVVLRNTSAVAVRVLSVTDTIGTQTAAVCANLIGITLAPGASSQPCTFPGTAPANGSATIDIVQATVAQVTNPTNTATAVDTAKVNTPPITPVANRLELDATKIVDANNDGKFNPTETAPAPGASVANEADFLNVSAVPVRIESIVHTTNGVTVPVCTNLVGTVIPAGQFSLKCLYPSTAPAAGRTLVDMVIGTVSEVGNRRNTGSDANVSRVITPPVGGQTPAALRVQKLVDANNDGVFRAQETAPAAGATVTYRVTVSNTGTVAERIDAVTDTVNGVSTAVCPALVGTTLPGGVTSAPCSYTGKAPLAGFSLYNIVQASVSQVGNPSNVAAELDFAKVSTPPGPAPTMTLEVVETVDADGNGVFHQEETASAPGRPVTHSVAVKNTSSVPLVVTGVSDFLDGAVDTHVCDALVNVVVQPGAQVTCTFVRNAPAAGKIQADVIVARGADHLNPANATAAAATAKVTTPR